MSEEVKKEDVIINHGNPYYFNAGELFYLLIVNAFTWTVALIFGSAIVATIKMCADGNDVGASWIAFFVVFLVVFIFIVILAHSKKHLMRFAHKFAYLHSSFLAQ